MHRILISGRISFVDAPMELRLRYALTPKVDGIKYEMPFQNAGMLLSGQLMPVRKRKGTDVNTTTSSTLSLVLTKNDIVMANIVHAMT